MLSCSLQFQKISSSLPKPLIIEYLQHLQSLQTQWCYLIGMSTVPYIAGPRYNQQVISHLLFIDTHNSDPSGPEPDFPNGFSQRLFHRVHLSDPLFSNLPCELFKKKKQSTIAPLTNQPRSLTSTFSLAPSAVGRASGLRALSPHTSSHGAQMNNSHIALWSQLKTFRYLCVEGPLFLLHVVQAVKGPASESSGVR